MVFSTEDCVLIKVLWHEKEYGAKNQSSISQQVTNNVKLEEKLFDFCTLTVKCL